MNASVADSLILAAPQSAAEKIGNILAAANLAPCAVCHTGAEAALAANQRGALLLTTWRLTDMTGDELAGMLTDDVDVLMIVPQDYAAQTPDNILILRNPISQDALVQAVRVLLYCHMRMHQLRVEAQRLASALEGRKIIDRAKGRLMDTLHLTEAEAHHIIQKKSMDTGRRLIDVAREIAESPRQAAL